MSDRKQLEEAVARELYFTWQVTQDKVLTDERKQSIRKTYGPGALERRQAKMLAMHRGELI